MKRFTHILAMLAALLLSVPSARAELAEVPAVLPSIPAATEERLAEALNAPGGSLAFANPADAYVWPMIPAEEDERLCVMSTNKGVDASQAAVSVSVEAKAGDALRITFKTSTETASDLMELRVNGETVKVFGGEKDWMAYAHVFPAEGTYAVEVAYVKDAMGGTGGDVVYIDEIALLTGEAASAAAALNPAYPTADETALTVLNGDARQILFDDPTYALLSLFGLADYYIVPSGEVNLLATLRADADPEAAFVVNYYDGGFHGLTQYMTAEGYAFSTPIDSVETTGYTYTNVHLYPSADGSIMDVKTVVCFASEADANAFVAEMPLYGYSVKGWSYMDGSAAQTDALPGEGVEAQAHYTLTFIDQQGEFIEGVTVKVSGGDFSERMTSDAEGVVEFAAAPDGYRVQVETAPEGCAFDAERLWTLDAEGGETIIDLVREIVEEE